MRIEVQVGWRQLAVGLAVLAAAVGLIVWWSAPARSQGAGPAEVDTFAFVARADNPVDALAASSVAGQLGAPVFLTFPDGLDNQATEGLQATDPDVVVLAGGTAALSEAVEAQVRDLLPDATVRRFAGAGRTETAKLINELTGELGVDRPVLVGATVAGDVGIDGNLTVDGTDLGAALAALTARVDTLEGDLAAADGRIDTLEGDLTAANGRIDTLESDLTTANGRIDTLESDLSTANGRIDTLESDLTAADGRIDALESTLAGVSRDGDLLTFSGMNVAVVNGSGATATTNGLGNLIVGYNEDHTDGACYPSDSCQYNGDNSADDRTGSHNLIVGVDHSFTSYGGFVAGLNNTISGFFTTVSGGGHNTATGRQNSVSGGWGNVANGSQASVSGGHFNRASGAGAWAAGGQNNHASSFDTSVSGGLNNTASGWWASVSGGRDNTAADDYTSVAGGRDGTIADVSGNEYDSLIGDTLFPDS